MKHISGAIVAVLVVCPNLAAQNIRPIIPFLDVDTLKGEATVYYSPGSADHAGKLGSILQDARALMRDSLGVAVGVDILLLDESGYEVLYDRLPYWWNAPIGVFFASSDSMVVMYTPENEGLVFHGYGDPMLRAVGPHSESLDGLAVSLGLTRDSVAVWFVNMAVAHEYGHHAVVRYYGGHPGGDPPNQHIWLNELLANLAQYATIAISQPERAELYKAALLAIMEGTRPPEEVSIQWFQGGIPDPQDSTQLSEGAFMKGWLRLRAAVVFDQSGFNFVRALDEVIPWPCSRRGCPNPTLDELWEEVVRIDPSFAVWVSNEDERPAVPSGAILGQSYPNPFSHSTTITYTLNRAGDVELKVVDLLGREVMVLDSGTKSAGSHTVSFGGSGLSSGVYFYRLHAEEFSASRQLLIAR